MAHYLYYVTQGIWDDYVLARDRNGAVFLFKNFYRKQTTGEANSVECVTVEGTEDPGFDRDWYEHAPITKHGSEIVLNSEGEEDRFATPDRMAKLISFSPDTIDALNESVSYTHLTLPTTPYV